jgi:tetratricopeptide (TPR) repeat protein
MSKKKKSSSQKTPKLSPSQTQSPDTMPDAELALRRAESEANTARRNREQGIELLSQGARLLAQSRPGEAAERLERAAILLPDDPDVAVNLGGAYVLQGRYNKAVKVLERASELGPESAMVWTNLAAAYLGNLEFSGPQQQSRALAAYERALQIDPATPNVYYNMGLIYNDRRDWPQAKKCFQMALEVDPNDGDARRWLTRLTQTVLVEDAPSLGQDSAHDVVDRL